MKIYAPLLLLLPLSTLCWSAPEPEAPAEAPAPDFRVELSTNVVSRTPEAFLRIAGTTLNVPWDELKILNKPRLGKMEVLVLILLHKKSGTPLQNLAQKRAHGMRMSRVVREENQDYRKIYEEAWQLRKQIDQNLSTPGSKGTP